MKGGFGCSPCCAPPGDNCTRTCTEPHSGDAFEVVYTRKFEGVEVGNTTDGYLTATGDSDTSDPYDGMDGTGPWFQQVGGAFNDGGSSGGGTRFPCTYRFSFWRSNYTLGASTIPPASTALTKNEITLTVSAGAIVFPDGRVITSADGAVVLASIPLVSGGASAADPRTNEGTVSFALQCQNVETQFSVQARIEWNTQKRQHVLYGIVRECYEEAEPECCSGSSLPDEIYLTISNWTGPDFAAPAPSINQTYILQREPNLCSFRFSQPQFCDAGAAFNPGKYSGAWAGYSRDLSTTNSMGICVQGPISSGVFAGDCVEIELGVNLGAYICGTGLIASGTQPTSASGAFRLSTASGNNFPSGYYFDWEIEA